MKKSRIKVKVRGTNGDPHCADVEISVDGEVWDDAIISRMELVVDANTSESFLRLDFPTFELDLDELDIPIMPINLKRIEKLRRFLAIVDKKE